MSSSVGSVDAFDTTTVEVSMPQQMDALQGSATGNAETIITTTGFSITSSLGNADGFNFAGWGRQAWGNSGWGVAYTVEVGGISISSSLGTVDAGDIQQVELTGQSITSSLGEISPADAIGISSPGEITSTLGEITSVGTLVGWGRNGWGEEPYGSSVNSLVTPTGVSSSFSVGSITPAHVMGLTGQEATPSVGSLVPVGS